MVGRDGGQYAVAGSNIEETSQQEGLPKNLEHGFRLDLRRGGGAAGIEGEQQRLLIKNRLFKVHAAAWF